MLFQFQLREIDQIDAWIHHKERYLHWFGFSDGWFWLNTGTDELLRYTDEILAYWNQQQKPPALPYVNYHVVRLWEDIQEMLPHVLEPIPANILDIFSPESDFIAWGRRVEQHLDDAGVNIIDPAWDTIHWIERRKLDAGYLQTAPRIWFWSDGVSASIHWDNRDITIDGIPVWTAVRGTRSMPVGEFIEHVGDFDQRFIKAMEARVNTVLASWTNPNIKVDFVRLVEEQTERSQRLQKSFRKVGSLRPTPWIQVLMMLRKIR